MEVGHASFESFEGFEKRTFNILKNKIVGILDFVLNY